MITLSRTHYDILLNVEFTWESDSLPNLENKLGPLLYITEKMISKAIAKIEPGKSAKPPGVMITLIR